MSCRLRGIGSFLPPRVVTNAEVGALSGIAPERIATLFEIRERRWVRDTDSATPAAGLVCSDLGAAAARAALADAALEPGDIDTLVTVSTTPDFMTPALDYLVAAKLGLASVQTFDLRAPCAGLFRAFLLLDALCARGVTRRALVVCAETYSPFFRFGPEIPKDHRLNTVLYADGAAALVVERTDDPAQAITGLTVRTTGDGAAPPVSFGGMLGATPPVPGLYERAAYLGHQDFRAVLERGTRLFWQAGRSVLDAAGAELDDCRYVLTHQATGNMRKHAEKIGVPPEKLPTNIEHVGNTVAASIGILMDELHRDGRLTAGDRLLVVAAESSSGTYAGMLLPWAAGC
jgi:3-oxoacyl-[acyl-carrier-protein] synthase-3